MMPIRNSKKLLQKAFPSAFHFEHPCLSMELRDSEIEVPMINTNLEEQTAVKWVYSGRNTSNHTSNHTVSKY